jgi:ABC-type proline/glycine betaine transport system substrate-binding protein
MTPDRCGCSVGAAGHAHNRTQASKFEHSDWTVVHSDRGAELPKGVQFFHRRFKHRPAEL